MWLALRDLFKAKWTEEIHSEWIRNVLKNRPDLTLEQLTRTKNLMNANVRDCLVTGYESLITTINLPDPDDRHVLAAAIHSQANIIVTFNLSDFPAKALQPYGVEAVHPDEFIQDLIDLNSEAVCTAAQKQRQTLKNPPKTQAEYLDTLLNTGLKQTVATLKLVCVEFNKLEP
ncbi:hypothetical protein DSM106972_095890 [Dulcicalothrix desertica PCC 7102]|uniref:Uncharacterized protein n=2 Tax=Dulcicalothrix desertica TaxID=32056 RepID=A0A3S1BRE6_9CYAN|nr:hypothetical protein DSM106972_095890 [Dulcicalothrix desertica PCC 7102]